MKSAVRGANIFDLGIIGAGILTFLFSFLPYYTVHISMFGQSVSESANAWHGFFGWFGALLALAGAAVIALPLMGITPRVPPRIGSVVLFGLSLLCVIIAGLTWPAASEAQGAAESAGIDMGDLTGHGVGYWLSLIVLIIAAALALLRKDSKS